MYEIKIVKKDSTKKSDGFLSEPRNYRVSIDFNERNKEIIITREFYRVGFRDGERWDEIYLDYNMGWRSEQLGIYHASIMTRNLDETYHIEIEKKLIETYYKNCFKSIDNIDKEIKKKTRDLKNQKDNYLNVINTLDKTFRKEKIEKIIHISND
jgi:hypothetical protein